MSIVPYIDPEKRTDLDPLIDRLTDEILKGESAWEGNLNYAISRLSNNIVLRRGKSYRLFNKLLGVMECVKQEVYRRLVAPYERYKMWNNGDVFGDLEND